MWDGIGVPTQEQILSTLSYFKIETDLNIVSLNKKNLCNMGFLVYEIINQKKEDAVIFKNKDATQTLVSIKVENLDIFMKLSKFEDSYRYSDLFGEENKDSSYMLFFKLKEDDFLTSSNLNLDIMIDVIKSKEPLINLKDITILASLLKNAYEKDHSRKDLLKAGVELECWISNYVI